MVRFENRLPEHLLAGLVSGFARTHHCNRFFLRHGAIDAKLEQGLLAAGEARLKLAVRVLQATAVRAGLDARAGNRAMTCCRRPRRRRFPTATSSLLACCCARSAAFPRTRRSMPAHSSFGATSTASGRVCCGHSIPAVSPRLPTLPSSCWGTATQRRSRISADLPMLTGVPATAQRRAGETGADARKVPGQRPLATGPFRHNVSGPLAPARGRPTLRRSARLPGRTYGGSLPPFSSPTPIWSTGAWPRPAR